MESTAHNRAELVQNHGPQLGSKEPNVQPSGIRSLIFQMEEQMEYTHQQQIQVLHANLLDKDQQIEGCATLCGIFLSLHLIRRTPHSFSKAIAKLKEDFEYNLSLIEGRDRELADYDAKFTNLQSVVRDRDVQLSELKIELADKESSVVQLEQRLKDLEAHAQQRICEAMEVSGFHTG
jgi:chromosome segregation ATPase